MSDIDRIPTDGNICLIDADSLIYYCMDKPSLEEAVYTIDERIKKILKDCNTTLYSGFLTQGRCFRYKVADSYKSNRKGGRPKPIVFHALKEYLKQQYNCTIITALEADDLVCYYSFTDNRKTIVCSPDKDVLFQCVGMHYNYQRSEFQHTTPDEALKFLWKQVLMGDSTDNIPGIPGVGAKTSENWLKDRTKDYEAFALKKFVEKFGMVEGVMKFHETFKLVYMLKTDDDMKREAGRTPPPLEVSQLSEGQTEELW